MPLVEVWGLEDLQGPPRALLDFISGIYTLTSLITFQWEALVDSFRHLILPAIALGTIPLAIIARITRSSLLDVLGLDYVRTARAKGLDDGSSSARHAFRNAMLPVVTIIGLQLGILLGGAVLTETIFNLAGVGKTVYDAIAARDYVVDPGLHADHRHRVPGREPARRHLLRVARPADPAELSDDAVTAEPSSSRDHVDTAARRRRGGPLARDARATSLRQRSAAGRAGPPRSSSSSSRSSPTSSRRIRPDQVLIGVEPGVKRRGRPVHPPPGLPGGPAAAPHGHRRQRPRRLQPRRLRRAHLAVHRLRHGRVRDRHRLVIGAIAGLRRRAPDNVLMRVMDVLLVFPALILAIAIVTVLGPGPHQRPARDRHRGDPDLRADHARERCSRSGSRTS